MERTYRPDMPAEPDMKPANNDQMSAANSEDMLDTPMDINDDGLDENQSGMNTPVGDGTGSEDGMEFLSLTPSSTASSGFPNAKSGERRPNMCPYCPFTCEAPSKLKCHMEIHENLKRFKCAHCGKRSNWTWDVRKHIKKEHPGLELSVIVMEEDEARDSLPGYLQAHYKIMPKKEMMDRNELPTQVPLNRITDQLPPVDTLGVLAPLQMANLSDGSYQDDDELEWDMSEHSLPFSSSTITAAQQLSRNQSIATKRCRPFKCSKCGRRSNWKWDMNKHIRNVHPTAKLIVLTAEEARATMPKGGFKNTTTGKKENYNTHSMQLPVQVSPVAPILPAIPSPVKLGAVSPTPSNRMRHNHQFDANRTKKFKCSACPYRSDYRSDIGRHLKRLHRTGSATIIMLSDEEANSTLQQYKDRWVRGKFVFSPAKEKMYEEYDKQHSGRKSLFGEQSDNAANSEGASYAGSDFNWEEEGPGYGMETENSSIKEEEFEQEGGEMDDMDTLVEPNKKWKCPQCPFTNVNKNMVVQHMKEHPRAKVFQCRLCGEASDYRDSMYRHVRNRHDTTDYSGAVHESIAFVTTVVKPRSEMNAETEEDEDEATPVSFRCKVCSVTSCWKSGIMRHVTETHKDEAIPADCWEVLQVAQVTPAYPQPVADDDEDCDSDHLVIDTTPRPSTSKLQRKPFICDTCPYKSNKSGLLKIHQTYHRPQPGNKYKCRYCPYYVSTMRLLQQHMKLHTNLESDSIHSSPTYNIPRVDGQMDSEGPDTDEPMSLDLSMPEGDVLGKSPLSPNPVSPGKRYYCDHCPAVSRNKNDFLYHKQFHRPKPSSPYKCKLCNYWVSQKRLLRQHERVHLSEYIEHYHYNNNNFPKPDVLKTYSDRGGPSKPLMVLASPAKSELSDYEDPVELANLKQQIIASKITTTPVSPEKFQENGHSKSQNDFTSDGYMVNPQGQLLKAGSLRKFHQCKHCPYVNIRATVLRMHETMHGAKPGKDLLKCNYCDYHVGNRGLLSHHMKVHSTAYLPGRAESPDLSLKVDKESGEEPSKETNENTDNKPGEKNEVGSMNTLPKGEVLDLSCLPSSTEYYVKYNEAANQNYMERASFKKWCCEKCPYATMKRAQFERHVSLHGSGQKYICEFCDYSVPAYHLLLQHKKLHLAPNPNLLTAQSITNLQRLPNIPADLAAATNFPSSVSDPASIQGNQDTTHLYENSSEFTEPKKVYRCDRCPYQNIRRDHLLSHLKFHMVQSELKCPHCDYSVSKQHLLVQHIKVHFSSPGSEGFSSSSSNGALNLPAFPQASVVKAPESSQAIKGEQLGQPEYIDIGELGDASLLDEVEQDGMDVPKVPTTDKAEVEEESIDNNVVENGSCDGKKDNGIIEEAESEVNGEKGDELACSFCDRTFDTKDKLHVHKRQHLIGSKQ